jgi:hypothetical protein
MKGPQLKVEHATDAAHPPCHATPRQQHHAAARTQRTRAQKYTLTLDTLHIWQVVDRAQARTHEHQSALWLVSEKLHHAPNMIV